MLSYLHVKNLALIDEAEVEFGPGLNILTGETGAGKSILIGSINLALGKKMSREMLRNPEKPALVELIFHVEDRNCLEKFERLGYPAEDGQVVISRKLAGNRSISRMNGEICSAAQIREVASWLLDIHGQHEHQSLLYQDRQLEILDAFGKEQLGGKKAAAKECFRKWQKLERELSSCRMDEEQRRREIAFLEFELGEISQAQLTPGEDEELEERYRKMSNGRQILESLSAVQGRMGYETENGAGAQAGRAVQELSRAAQYDGELSQLSSMLGDIDGLINDFNRELADYSSRLVFSQEEFYETEQRLNLLNHLKSRYGKTIPEILEYEKKKRNELERLYHFEEYKAGLEQETEAARAALDEACGALSLERQELAGALAGQIREGLADLNFLDVVFEISFDRTPGYTADGWDRIEFRISTNPGEPVRPLARVVSGGELSRIMLAIKTILADKDETETLIFDEIDTGISGRTAQKVSEKLAVIGRGHQVLCITHLPQIAAMADLHYEILKKVEQGETSTRIRTLTQEESVRELARLLGGARITSNVLASAKEMKELAQVQKNTRLK